MSIGLAVLQGHVGGQGGVEASVAVPNAEAGTNDRGDGDAVVGVGVELTSDVESGGDGAVTDLNVSGHSWGQSLSLREKRKIGSS